MPPVRVVLRWLLLHEVDSNERLNLQAGQMAVLEAIRRTNPVLLGCLDPDPLAALAWQAPQRAAGDLRPTMVSDLLPAGYAYYFRIFHRWSDCHREDRLATWRDLAEQAGAVYHDQMQSPVIWWRLRPPRTDVVWEIGGYGDG